MAGFLRGWLRDEPLARLLRLRQRLRRAGRLAPRLRAGDAELDRAAALPRPRLARRARCATTPSSSTCTARPPACADWPELAVLAFDHRMPARGPRRRRRATAARAHRRASRRCSRRRAARRGSARARRRARGFGVIVDDRYGEDVLPPLTGSGGWVARPVELPGSRPLAFEAGPTARAGAARLADRARRQVPGQLSPRRRRGAARGAARAAAARCRRPASRTDRELLVEVIPPRELAARRRHPRPRAGRRSTPPAFGPTGGSCRRRQRAPHGQRIAAAIAAPRPALPRRPAARPRGERGRAGAQLRDRRAAPDLPRLRGRPLDLRARRRRPGSPAARATTRSSPTSPRATPASIALWRAARDGCAAARADAPASTARRGHRMTTQRGSASSASA